MYCTLELAESKHYGISFVRFEHFLAVEVAQLPSEETGEESLCDETMTEPPSGIFLMFEFLLTLASKSKLLCKIGRSVCGYVARGT